MLQRERERERVLVSWTFSSYYQMDLGFQFPFFGCDRSEPKIISKKTTSEGKYHISHRDTHSHTQHNNTPFANQSILSSLRSIVKIKSYLQSSAKFIGKLCAPDRVSAFARASGVACLNHEPLDVTVEQIVIIISARAQCQKVLLQANKQSVRNPVLVIFSFIHSFLG